MTGQLPPSPFSLLAEPCHHASAHRLANTEAFGAPIHRVYVFDSDMRLLPTGGVLVVIFVPGIKQAEEATTLNGV